MQKVTLKNKKPKTKAVVDAVRPVSSQFQNALSSGGQVQNFDLCTLCREHIAQDEQCLTPYAILAETYISRGDYASAIRTFEDGATVAFATLFENASDYEDGCVHLPYKEESNHHIFHFLYAYAKALWQIGRRTDAEELLLMIVSLDESDPLMVLPDVVSLKMGFGAEWKKDFASGCRRELVPYKMQSFYQRYAPLFSDVFIIQDNVHNNQ